MATPRVFVSSTCYDLKYVRENLRYFIKTLGYEPILSEDGDVYYSPALHTHEACLSEVASCQMMVLIIGGRYGGEFKGSDRSITNHEYEAAVARKIPIFALVDSSVLSEHYVYGENRKNPRVDENEIAYPSTNDTRIFAFIDQVRRNMINNAIVPFKDFSDIESYLKKQWAGMMYEALTRDSEAKRVGELFESLRETTQNVQFMTRQLVNSSQDNIIRLNVEFYDYILSRQVVHDLSYWKIFVTPRDILLYVSFDEITGGDIEIDEESDEYSITYGGPPFRLSIKRYERNCKDYSEIRNYMARRLAEVGIAEDQFLKETESSVELVRQFNNSPSPT